MLTRNYYIMNMASLDGVRRNLIIRQVNGGEGFSGASGSNLNSLVGIFNNNLNYAGYHFGSGTTPPTINDYTLENPIVNSSVSCTTTRGIEGITFTITNGSATPITISEVGLSVGWGYHPDLQSTAFYGGAYLMMREVLTSPVTIPADGVGVIKLKYDLPAAIS